MIEALQSALVVRKRCVEYGQRKKQGLSVQCLFLNPNAEKSLKISKLKKKLFHLDLLTQNTRTKPISNLTPKLHQNYTISSIQCVNLIKSVNSVEIYRVVYPSEN